MDELLPLYEKHKDEIRRRLEEFKTVKNLGPSRVFSELAFCICTPQSPGQRAWQAVLELQEKGFLSHGSAAQIASVLKKYTRFHTTKATHIVLARHRFQEIHGRLHNARTKKMRAWLADNVLGLGYKEASHFLRNIGFVDGIAILDRHILRNMKQFGVIRNIPPAISKKRYLYLEKRMKHFATTCGIPLHELDLLLWAKETGAVFK